VRDFAFCNAAIVDSGRDFQHHMDRLIRSMNSLLKVESPSAHRPWLWAVAGALVYRSAYRLLSPPDDFLDWRDRRYWWSDVVCNVGATSILHKDQPAHRRLLKIEKAPGTREEREIFVHDLGTDESVGLTSVLHQPVEPGAQSWPIVVL
jgi:hypothetical protein